MMHDEEAEGTRLEAELLWTIAEAMKSVPHLKARAAAETFRDIRFHLADDFEGLGQMRFVRMSDETMAKIAPLGLCEEDLEGLSMGAASGGDRLTPKGARLLARMVRTGALPFSRKIDPAQADTASLEAYGAREGELLKASADLRAERAAKREAREAAWAALNARAAHLALHPDEADAAELTRELVDRIFIQSPDFGYGRGGMILLGGARCFKTFDLYVSNSGKTRQTTPVVWWIDPFGRRHGDPAPDPAKNRRSDPDRNYGLGRE